MWYRIKDSGIEIFVKVIPNAQTSKIVGVLGNRLKIRIAAPPEAGKANKVLISFLSEQLGTSQHDIMIKFGTASSEKNIFIKIPEENIQKLVE